MYVYALSQFVGSLGNWNFNLPGKCVATYCKKNGQHSQKNQLKFMFHRKMNIYILVEYFLLYKDYVYLQIMPSFVIRNFD
jgi:hypothetical protein